MTIRQIFVAAMMATALSGCAAIHDTILPGDPAPAAQMVTLSGNVVYRERMALPADARVTVTVSDVSLADAPSVTIASTTFAAGGRQVPLPYQLSYDASRLEPRHIYSVSARIDTAQGQLLWITDTHTALPPAGQALELNLVRTRNAAH